MLARLLSAGSRSDQALGLARLWLPTPAREYLLDKLLPVELLVTGLTREDAKRLRRTVSGGSEDPVAFPLHVPGTARGDEEGAFLSGRLDQVERLVHALRATPETAPLGEAIGRALGALQPPPALRLGSRRWAFGQRSYLMGVVNVTPDSFYDGGRHATTERAVAHGVRLAEAGADLLDVGGESTRPGSDPVGPDEEQARVVAVIRGLRDRTQVPISVDTRKAAVAEAALDAGASMVNDVSGLSFDPSLAAVVARHGAALCVMHMKGTPATMQQGPRYDDVVEEVLAGLAASLARAQEAGIAADRLLVDPGVGFGKSLGHNLFLLRRLFELRVLERPIVLGTSRKSFLGTLTSGRPAEERLAATLGSIAAAVATGGADVLRVHDVAEAKDALAVVDAVRIAQDGGTHYAVGPVGAGGPGSGDDE